ncbi:MAG: hypothetical protein R2748_23505 [Bryobacterales bacterium]
MKTTGLEAEYGGALGGVVTAVTKSGGNDFHGSAHMYYYGNAIAAGLVKRLELDPNTQATDKYIQDSKQSDNNWGVRRLVRRPDHQEQNVLLHRGHAALAHAQLRLLVRQWRGSGSMERKFRQINLFSKLYIQPHGSHPHELSVALHAHSARGRAVCLRRFCAEREHPPAGNSACPGQRRLQPA